MPQQLWRGSRSKKPIASLVGVCVLVGCSIWLLFWLSSSSAQRPSYLPTSSHEAADDVAAEHQGETIDAVSRVAIESLGITEGMTLIVSDDRANLLQDVTVHSAPFSNPEGNTDPLGQYFISSDNVDAVFSGVAFLTKPGFYYKRVALERGDSVVKVALEASHEVEVSVKDQGGNPIAGCTVLLSGRPLPASAPVTGFKEYVDEYAIVQRAETDQAGHAVARLPRGPIFVHCFLDGYIITDMSPGAPEVPESASIQVTMAHLFGVAFRTSGGCSVRRVVARVPNQEVILSNMLTMMERDVAKRLGVQCVALFVPQPELQERGLLGEMAEVRMVSEHHSVLQVRAPVLPVENIAITDVAFGPVGRLAPIMIGLSRPDGSTVGTHDPVRIWLRGRTVDDVDVVVGATEVCPVGRYEVLPRGWSMSEALPVGQVIECSESAPFHDLRLRLPLYATRVRVVDEAGLDCGAFYYRLELLGLKKKVVPGFAFEGTQLLLPAAPYRLTVTINGKSCVVSGNIMPHDDNEVVACLRIRP